METVYSRYEIKNSSIKFDKEESATVLDCVGSLEQELNVKTVTKSCEGVVKKQRTRGDGTGTLNISLHCPYSVYQKIYGFITDTLQKGVSAYGKNSIHKIFSYTGVVLDEDGVELLVAYPVCVATSAPHWTVENGAEEVGELELEVGLMPDEYDNCVYEAPVKELDETVTKENWLKNFTPSMVQKAVI